MEFSKLLSKGERVDVYQNGDLAVKVFEKDYPQSLVLYEALVYAQVEETGLPVPRIMEIVKQEEQWTISMEYVEGKTLAQLMQETPEKQEEYVALMVDLLMDIHDKRIPSLVKLKDVLFKQINEQIELDATQKYELLSRLNAMPKHIKLCHGNFGPENIVIKDGKAYILDWIAAAQGNASADAGRAYLLLCLSFPQAADRFLDLFCEKSGTDKKYVQEWLPIVAASYLRHSRPQEKDLLAKWMDIIEFQ